jgi:hypothetical protein
LSYPFFKGKKNGGYSHYNIHNVVNINKAINEFKTLRKAINKFKVSMNLKQGGFYEFKVDLPGEYKVSATFNVSDLSPSLKDPLQVPDGPITRSDPLLVPDGPIIRSRAKKIKETM